jgi:hypothetical protein
MSEVLAAFEGRLAALHCFNKAIFFFEVAQYNILHEFIRVETLLSCAFVETCLQIGRKLHFHVFQATKSCVQRQLVFGEEFRKRILSESAAVYHGMRARDWLFGSSPNSNVQSLKLLCTEVNGPP